MKRLFSGEVFFALFLFSGVFKESLGFPVDLAAVFLGLTTLSILKRVYKNPRINTMSILPLMIFMGFLGLVLFSVFYSPSIELTQNKTIKLILLTTPAFMYPFILLKTKESLTRFFLSLAAIATVMSLFSFPMLFQRGELLGFVGFNEGNYLGLARVSGIGLVILLFLGVLNDSLKKYRLIFLVSTLGVLISLLGSGGRMPVIAVLIALFLIFVSSIRIKNGELKYPKYYNKIFTTTMIMLIPIVWAYNKGYFNSMIFRFEVLLQSGGGDSVTARTTRLNTAIDIWKNNFMLGSGFGSFGEFFNSDVPLDYPHNLFLELMSELGIIGLVVFSLLLILAIMRFVRVGRLKVVRNNNLFITIAITFLVTFINAMASGDINGNRIMLTLISIMSLSPLIFKEEIKSVKNSII